MKVKPIPRLTSGNHWPVKTTERIDCQECKRKRGKGDNHIIFVNHVASIYALTHQGRATFCSRKGHR
jgi:hypothetical protein